MRQPTAVERSARGQRRSFLVLTQVFTPDTPAVGQMWADVVDELGRRGHHVTVLTSSRSYEDASLRFATSEHRGNVEIRRFPLSSFGKRSMTFRLLAGILFTLQSFVRGLFIRRIDAVLVSTVPPFGCLAALGLARLRRVPFKFWIMDLNPDQAIAMGAVKEGAASTRLFERVLRAALRCADDVVVLDRYMAARVETRGPRHGRLSVVAPWSLDDHLSEVPAEANTFLSAHGLSDRFVVMYAGNHSAANPLDTALAAAAELQHDPRIVFVFIGGGSEKARIEHAGLPNVLSLPYEPLDRIKYSLSAADLHLVSIGDPLVGIVHPCKIYSAMAVARPVLCFGPEQSHLSDLVASGGIGWYVAHGDVSGAVDVIRAAAADRSHARRSGRRAQAFVGHAFGKARLCGELCDIFER